MRIKNTKERLAQEFEDQNLDLIIKNDNKAASPSPLLLPYKDNKSIDFTNR